MPESKEPDERLLTREQYKEIEQRRAQDDMQALLDHADATIPEEVVEIIEPEEEEKPEAKTTKK